MIHAMAKIEANCTLNVRLYNALLESCHLHKLSVLQSVKHDFFPHGMTAVVLLAESHATIHTFPEWNQVFIDVFTCGKADPYHVIKSFAQIIGGKILAGHMVDRLGGEKRKALVYNAENPNQEHS